MVYTSGVIRAHAIQGIGQADSPLGDTSERGLAYLLFLQHSAHPMCREKRAPLLFTQIG